MTAPTQLTLATRTFEAARELPTLDPGHRCHGLHGHSFQASVFAALPPDWGDYPGAECDTLSEALGQSLAPLDYGYLNDHVSVPSDENLARWLRHEVKVPALQRIALQSTPWQGVDLDHDGRVHRWRTFVLHAAHQLPHVPAGHQCGRMHGHRFEVRVHECPAQHAVAPLHYDDLDAAWQPIAKQLHCQCLNDIAGLDNPTSEHLAAWIWHALQPRLPALSGITVLETRSSGAHFDGSHYRIWKSFHFDSACQLTAAPASAPRHRLHGLSYTLRLHLQGPLDTVLGWITDYGDVKAQFQPILAALDHHPLHAIADLPQADTPALARWLMARTQTRLPALSRLDLYETPGCGSVLAHASTLPMLPV